ncbi:nuclear transport factor 2 family protein [Rhodococcus sp. NCIMB 12038]|uniref:nuclear transport factor 2 family protein n=1 Tax=Rhodococcus sp. NCIMB 12038 TaxID=933800 RepID=UPI000B3CAECA|nr:nuclear transport factor 2 family protein [Rhodococcus sp. NCIMB 12038]OUS82225.1 hypothetical protein CA951_41225 [Rhodococcus sp. NCIMB 12038]
MTDTLGGTGDITAMGQDAPTYFEQALGSLRTAETHIGTEFQDDLELTLDTITKAAPRFVFMPVPGRIRIETQPDQVRAFYEGSRAEFLPDKLRARHHITSDWFYFVESLASRRGTRDGQEYTVNTAVLFPKAPDGIVGEFLWERYDVEVSEKDPDRFDIARAPGARTDLPLRPVAALFVHDRIVEALRNNDAEALTADYAHDFLLGARNYLAGQGPMVAGEGREAALAYWRQFFDEFTVDEVSVLNRLTGDWYVFAEVALTVTVRRAPEQGQRQFRTASIFPILADGRVQGELSYGTEIGAASTRETGTWGRAFFAREGFTDPLF